MQTRVTTAVFPVGGFGTRFLPTTKTIPKEMLPVVDKPIIQYAVEEARAAGCTRFVFVTSHGKGAIEDHFDTANELVAFLRSKGKEADAVAVEQDTPEPGSCLFVRQGGPLGLGHAVWCAREAIGDAPFAVLLPDDMVLAETPCLAQMTKAYAELDQACNMAAVVEVPAEHTKRYGILDIDRDASLPDRLSKAKGLVEKPDPSVAPSRLSIIGRYILDPAVLRSLAEKKTGSGGEIQLTDAMSRIIPTTPFYGYRFEGTRYDCGDKAGYVLGNLAYALQRGDIGPAVREGLDAVLKSGGLA